MPSELLIILFIVLGLVSGLLGGMLGIGGGVVTVPVLYFIFLYGDLFGDRLMQVAISTSLAAGMVTSAISTYFQVKKGAFVLSHLRLLMPGLFFGCIGGSILAHTLSSHFLGRVFGLMALLLGTYFFFPRLPHLQISARPNRTLAFFGVAIGALSSLLGIGGGSLTFPVLLGYQVPVQNASATSSGATLLTTLLGSATYLAIAWHKPQLPFTFGYIEMPAFLAISAATILTAPLGVRLSHTLNVVRIKQIFGACLALIGASMLFL